MLGTLARQAVRGHAVATAVLRGAPWPRNQRVAALRTLARGAAPTAAAAKESLRARVNAVLAREFTPSPFLVRARKFSDTAGAAAAAGGNSLLRFPRENPFATNMIIATVKTSLCDILVQKYVEGKDNVDWKRVAVFTAFGCLYLGAFQWLIYVTLFSRLFPGMAKFANMPFREKLKDRRGMINLVGQTAFDNFVHYTFIYFPVFYVFKESIQGTGYEKTFSSVTQKSLGKYKENFVEDNLKIFALWIPGDMIIYAAPMWLRLPLNHALSFIWTCYLSFLRGEKIDDDATQQPAAEEVPTLKVVDAPSGGAATAIEVQDVRVVSAGK